MDEKIEFIQQYKDFYSQEVKLLSADIKKQLKSDLQGALSDGIITSEKIMKMMRVASIAHREIQLRHYTIEAVLLLSLIHI